MNQDAREDHTLRNALLLTGGLAAGGVGGVKLLEKAAAKGGVKKSLDDMLSQVKNKSTKAGEALRNATKSDSNPIKSKPKKTAKANATENIPQKIEELKNFLQTLEVDLAKYKKNGNVAKVLETEKLIGQVKERLAKMRGF